MPKVSSYPVCSECEAPYVLRRCFVVNLKPTSRTKGTAKAAIMWLWQRDCKHKKAKTKAVRG